MPTPLPSLPAEALKLRVIGLVQGVHFRATTAVVARKLGLRGWVRNLADGSVEIVAEGEREALEHLLTWSRHGPAGAQVEQVESAFGPATGAFTSFEVEH